MRTQVTFEGLLYPVHWDTLNKEQQLCWLGKFCKRNQHSIQAFHRLHSPDISCSHQKPHQANLSCVWSENSMNEPACVWSKLSFNTMQICTKLIKKIYLDWNHLWKKLQTVFLFFTIQLSPGQTVLYFRGSVPWNAIH